MKKEEVLELIEEKIEISADQMEDFTEKVEFRSELKSFRKEIFECQAIAMDIYDSVKEKLDDLNKISIVTAISKLKLSVGHLGTAIKNNRDFSPAAIILEFLKTKAGNIAASIAKDMIDEIIAVLIEEPELVQVSNYESLLKKKLTANGWEIGEEYEAKDKKLDAEFFEGTIPQPLRQLFAEYIPYRSQFGYPYAMVINSGADVKSVVDDEGMNNAIEKERYQDGNGTFLESYEMLNIFQRVDWLRKKLGIVMEEIDNFDQKSDDYEIHVVFSSMELHDVRVLFGHLLPILK